MIKRKICISGLLLACILTAQADNNWTLQNCIDHALQHNIQIQKSRLSEQTSQQTTAESKAALLPSLSASLSEAVAYRPFQQQGGNFVNGSVASSTSNKTIANGNYGVNASWTLWNGNQNRNTIKSNQLSEQIASLQTQQTANTIQEQIAQLYVQILYTQEAVKTNQKLLENDEQLLQRGQELLRNGKATQADVAQLQAQVDNGKYDVVNSCTQIASYKMQLRQLLQLSDTVDFNIQTPEGLDTQLIYSIPSINQVYQAALQSRPEIKSSQLAIEQSNLDLKIAQGAYSPTISLTAGLTDSHMTGTGQTIGNQLRDNFDGQIGVNISIPIFDNRKRKTTLEKAKINQLNSQLDLQDNQLNLRNTIESYWLEATNNKQKYEASKSQVKSQQTSYELVSEQFKQGKQNIAQLLESRTSLLSAEQTMLQSQYTTLLNVTLLKFYQNEKLSF